MSPSRPRQTPSILVFGGGWLGHAMGRDVQARGGTAWLTSRSPKTRAELADAGFQAVDPVDPDALKEAVSAVQTLLVTTPPEPSGCPGLRALVPALSASGAWPDWIGYISSSAVYGDRAGAWAFEDEPLHASSLTGARRVRAEAEWLEAGQGMGLTIQIFRLPALYGPGRNVIGRLRDGTARLVHKPGQVFNRIHVDDVVSGLRASMDRPNPGRAYTLCDDAPSPADAIMAWTARRMGLPTPPEIDWTDPSVSDSMRRFYLDNKRLSNARAKAELGWRPRYPSYREGMEALLREE